MATIDINDTVQLTHTAAQVDADIDGSVRADISQSFTDSQKAQARANIGASSGGGINLLTNPFFTINQRGQTTYSSSASAYTFDRWYMVENSNAGGVKVEKITDGIRFTKLTASGGYGGRIAQRIDDYVWNSVRGKQITYSITYKSTISFLLGYGTTYGGVYAASITCPASSEWVTVKSTRTVGASSSDYWFSLAITNATEAGTIDIKCIKFEEGSISSIEDDIAPDYYSELLKCKRYFVRKKYVIGDSMLTGYSFSTTEARLSVNLETPMRKAPTVTISNLSSPVVLPGNHTVTSVVGAMWGEGNNFITLRLATSGLTAGQVVTMRNSSEIIDVDLNAEY